MNTSDKDKAKKGAEGISEFLKQFGDPDTQTQVTLSIIFKELLNYGRENKPPTKK